MANDLPETPVSEDVLSAEFLTDFMDTLRHAGSGANALLLSMGESIPKQLLGFDSVVSPLGTTAVVSVRVRDLAVRDDWSHQLGDVLTNYRSALDSFAFSLATIFAASRSLSEKEAGSVYYPLADTETKWREITKKGWLKSLPAWLQLRIRATQPFLLPDPQESILWWLHEIDRKRKHRWKLRLRPVLDPQMPHIFYAIGRNGEEFRVLPEGQEQVNIGQPLMDGLNVFHLHSPRAMVSVRSGNGPFVGWWLSRDGTAATDLQDFLIAVNAKLQQIFAAVVGGDSSDSDRLVAELSKPAGFGGRWGDRLDDTGATLQLTVRPARGYPTGTVTLTASNSENLLDTLNRGVGEWAAEHGRVLPVSGYDGKVDFASFYYPDANHFPDEGTIRFIFPDRATVADLRSVFGLDLEQQPPVIEVEINHGRGGGGVLALFFDSLQVTLALVEAYGVYAAGRQLVGWISRKVLAAPTAEVRAWAGSGVLPDSIRDYMRKNREWLIIDVERLFDLDPLHAAELLRQSGFYSAESAGMHWFRTDLDASATL